MYKALIGVGALLLATTAMPASAVAWDDNGYSGNGYYNGYNSNGYNNGYYNNGYGNGYRYRGYYDRRYYDGYDYDSIRQHVRACRRHERFHEALNRAHEAEHEQGAGYGEDRDVHEALSEAHQEYHENHPGAHDCNWWYGRYNNYNRGYYGRPYYRSYNYSYGGGY